MDKNTSTLKFCVYLLTSINPGFKYHTYIGKTTSPPRRIKQHNGIIAGGAFKTESKRPWEMVVVVHSFPTQAKVLQFEWDWQHPEKGKRVKDAYEHMKGKQCGTMFSLRFKIRLLAEMLQMPAYCRLPLGIYVTTHRYDEFLEGCPALPEQMVVQYGAIEDVMKFVGTSLSRRRNKGSKRHNNIFDNVCHTTQSELSELINEFHLDEESQLKKRRESALVSPDEKVEKKNTPMEEESPSETSESDNENLCCVCKVRMRLDEKAVHCTEKGCSMRAHLTCLGRLFTREQDILVPTVGVCPKCHREMRWGDVIKDFKARTGL
ncbi:hypothetical protein EIN_469570 [Entamoeba invadens IP1]|uniref:Structure-specific endonuclease subunit SLX1 homolog n=1 Tax=Entamoeba invadens IP1 TaxID=370355 RepID=A0A0A1TWL3_ENTIV|nr:hypothetical protein EIN_469570 [Entamoeba invadens IP1]ELP83743.1 hypothetical protein EIN_469570 [Entamoeba invadens IP1]|eukprot:XP_004183089.1 hypothetical protein EIN_469570 [Entamoeba invadens IP1]